MNSKILFAGIIAAIILIVGALGMFLDYKWNIDSLNKSVQENLSQIQAIEKAQASNDGRGPRGPPGARGPPGPDGRAGATFQAFGPLRNLQSSGGYVMDRLHGSGAASVAYLNKLTYQPNQIWTYLANNQISNKYGECLQGDSNTGNVYMAGCNPNSTAQQWRQNNYGQISLVDGGECLDISLESQFGGASKIESGTKLARGNTHYNLQRVKLKQCDPSNNLKASQQWVFA